MAVTGEHIYLSFVNNTAPLFWITHCTCYSCRIQHAYWSWNKLKNLQKKHFELLLGRFEATQSGQNHNFVLRVYQLNGKKGRDLISFQDTKNGNNR